MSACLFAFLLVCLSACPSMCRSYLTPSSPWRWSHDFLSLLAVIYNLVSFDLFLSKLIYCAALVMILEMFVFNLASTLCAVLSNATLTHLYSIYQIIQSSSTMIAEKVTNLIENSACNGQHVLQGISFH